MSNINKVYPLIIDLVKNVYPVQENILFCQEDTNSAYIDVELLNNGEIIDITNIDVLFNAQRKDGEVIQSLVDKYDPTKGKCRLNLTHSMVEEAGLLQFQIQLTHGDKISSTQTFFINIERAIVNGDSISEDDNFPVLVELIEKTTRIKNEVDSNLKTISSVKDEINLFNAKIKKDEENRCRAEDIRKSEHATRIKNIDKLILETPTIITSQVKSVTDKSEKEIESRLTDSINSYKNEKSNEIEEVLNQKGIQLIKKVDEKLATIPPKEELKGDKGDGIYFKGSVELKSQLPKKSDVNDMYYVREESKKGIYIYSTEKEWILIPGLGANEHKKYPLTIEKDNVTYNRLSIFSLKNLLAFRESSQSYLSMGLDKNIDTSISNQWNKLSKNMESVKFYTLDGKQIGMSTLNEIDNIYIKESYLYVDKGTLDMVEALQQLPYLYLSALTAKYNADISKINSVATEMKNMLSEKINTL